MSHDISVKTDVKSKIVFFPPKRKHVTDWWWTIGKSIAGRALPDQNGESEGGGASSSLTKYLISRVSGSSGL
jgi:hypothetical protein